jgi:hypothetical protein
MALVVGHNLVRKTPDFTTGWEQILFQSVMFFE